MKLLAFSCNNIGPFFDRTVSVIFHNGSHIIQAPIGSGKSFLFFDGPVFGLYKSSSRPILSIKATQGFVKILFEHEGKIIFCVRNIARTKSGNDTVKSLLYTIENISLESIYNTLATFETVIFDKDIHTTLSTLGTWEQIECKNETDVQATLEPFLPAQDVFLNTTILMQDSTNVFDLTPGERISLFKEIFGLLSIDSATEKISDERKAVTTLIKSKQTTDDQDVYLKKYLQERTSIIQKISAKLSSGSMTGNFQESLSQLESQLQTIGMIQENITMTGFDWDTSATDSIHQLTTLLQDSYNDTQRQLGSFDLLEKSLDELAKKQKQLDQQKSTIQQTITTLSSRLTSLEALTKETTDGNNSPIQEQETWLQTLPAGWFTTLSERNFSLLWDKIQEFMQEGILFTEKEKNLVHQIEQLQDKQTTQHSTLQSYETQLTQLQTDYDQKKKFYCEKIGDDCPFIEQINNGFFRALQKNIDSIQATITQFKQGVTQEDTGKKITDLQKTLEETRNQISSFKQHIWYTDYKVIKKAKEEYDALIQQQQAKMKQQQQVQGLINEYNEKKGQLGALELQLPSIEKEQEENTQQITSLQQNIATSGVETLQQKLRIFEQTLQDLQKSTQLIDRIEQLIKANKDTQWMIKKLRERETLLNDLYRIFSKELMIKVLEDALPFFADFINNILAKIVSFSIHFSPRKTASDKLELDITIRDDHGERTAKSLSGGQKAILRLAWILGVAKMTNSSQLFLDETINNIDHNTISAVTDMLEDYLKTTKLDLYLVTHSPQLQDMQVWDERIEFPTSF